jgi:hypothetical protein
VSFDGDDESENATIESVGVVPENDTEVDLSIQSSTEPLRTSPRFNVSRVSRDDDALAYFSIDSSVSNEQIERATIRLRVPKSAVDQETVDPEDVTMYRFDERDEPVAQPTEFIEEIDSSFVYEVTSDGFSEWVAGTKRPSLRVSQASIALQASGGGNEDQARVDARITNDGEADAVYVTRLLLNEDIVEERRVTVPQGGTVQVTFQRDFRNTGTYRVTVNNVTAGTVSVAENGSVSVAEGTPFVTTTEGDTTGLFGPTLSTSGRVMLLVVLALVGYAAIRRGSDSDSGE